MSGAFLYAVLSVTAVGLVSLVGLFMIPMKTVTGRIFLALSISFAAGALLGDVFLHLLPELAEEGNFHAQTSIWILGTIVAFFVLEKFLHWHYHAEGDEHGHREHPLVWNILIGDSMHNFVDGLVIAGAFQVDIKLGFATTLAVMLHEIPQELGDFSALVYGGFSRTKALLTNLFSGLTAVLGAITAFAFTEYTEALPVLIAIGAGSFIYIAIADLIPQIHNEKKQSLTQLLSFGLGIAVMFALLLVE